MCLFKQQKHLPRGKRQAYYLYSEGIKTVHSDNDLERLIEMGKRLSAIFRCSYSVKNIDNEVVWEV